MTLRSPFQISSRLLPALHIAGAWMQLEYSRIPRREGRTRYRWTIDLPNGESFSKDDLQSGCQGGNLQEGFESLLSFLDAAGESYNYRGPDGENADLFPPAVVQWAADNSDQIFLAFQGLEDSPNLIEE